MSISKTPLAKTFAHMEIKNFKKPEYDIYDEDLKQRQFQDFLSAGKKNPCKSEKSKFEKNEGEKK